MVDSQPSNNPESGLSPFQGTFVGRLRKVADLKAALEDAMSGHGRLVMLAGEPGIGKTRTASYWLPPSSWQPHFLLLNDLHPWRRRAFTSKMRDMPRKKKYGHEVVLLAIFPTA